MFFSVISVVLLAAIVGLLIALLLRPRAVDSREDIARLRQAQIEDARLLRDDLMRYSMQTDQRAEALRVSMTSQLETMRATVDEKLQSTLETRLGESFRLVSERLE